MTMAMSRSAYKQQVVNSGLTKDGKDWLLLALDPFHDFEHAVAGYPDADSSQTIVQCFQFQQEVKAPVAVVGNWDAHVYNSPQAVYNAMDVATLDANLRYVATPAAGSVSYPQSLLNVVTNEAGGSLAPEIGGTPPNQTRACLPPINDTSVANGIGRVIGMGYEITNTTAEMYKQGSITSYRMPQCQNTMHVDYYNTLSNVRAGYTAEVARLPPQTPNQANLLKGTRTWQAAEGVYAVCFQTSIHNPHTQLTSQPVLYASTTGTGAASTVVQTQPNFGFGAAPPASATTAVQFMANKTIPFDTTGVFLQGLSNQTTLTIKLKVYVERSPTWFDSNLAVLASPSAGYDVHALEMYAAAINRLPPAVKVGENAKGDWWRAVLGVLKTAAGPIGMALNPFMPGAGILGSMVQTVAGQIDTSKGKSIAKQLVPPQHPPQPVEEQKKRRNRKKKA